MSAGRPARALARLALSASLIVAAHPILAQEPAKPEPAQVRLSPEQMLVLSQATLARGDAQGARRILEVLVDDPTLKVRNEARFRLAMMALAANDLTRSAVLLRAILDDEPSAQRAHLELARVLSLMGDTASARRELRQAQAGQLPPEVARVVERFAAVLREYKRVGGSVEMALAPDRNINRATRSDTLTTVIGDFDLDDNAQAQSGIGLAVRGTGYVRQPVSADISLLGQAGFDGNFYRRGEFNDLVGRLAAGAEWQLPKGRLRSLVNYQRRWFGPRLYSQTVGLDADWEHSLSRTAQLRLSGGLSDTDVVANDTQDAVTYFLSGTVEKALSPRKGISGTLSASRNVAADPGFSSWYAYAGAFAWRELGRTTLIAGASLSRLVADSRLLLYPDRRKDNLVRLSLAATMRQVTVAGFSPQLRLTWERNSSTIEVYGYKRIRAEVGIVRGF